MHRRPPASKSIINLVENMTSKLTNVLVTGGAGYVGHVLTPRLLSLGYKVTVIDKLWYGARLPNDPNLRVVDGDIRDTALMSRTAQGPGCGAASGLHFQRCQL